MNRLVNQESLGELGFKKLNSPEPVMSLWICPDFEQDHHIYLRWSARMGFFYGSEDHFSPIPIQDLQDLIILLNILRKSDVD